MNCHPYKIWLWAINILGGTAVIASYAIGIITHPQTRGALWGNVPKALLPWYTVSMLAAAAGYCAFSYYILFRVDPEGATVAGRFSYGVFPWLYALILVPSALWMPLTFAMIGNPSPLLWVAVRVVLGVTGIASLLLLAAIIALEPHEPVWPHRIAVVGCAAFSLQTAFLDALVWPYYFPS